MFTKGKCSDNRSFYDLDMLKEAKRPIDKLYEYVIYHNNNLPKYYKRNTALKYFNDITLQLVLDFKLSANTHIKELINNVLLYGSLYHLAQINHFNNLYIEYTTFPLINQNEQESIMREIKSIAVLFYKEDTLLYNITCLELLYFFSLIINSAYSWICIDYISNGNRNHQYVISTETYDNMCRNDLYKTRTAII